MRTINLNMRTINLKFRGLDNFNRPVFKDVESKSHFGSVNKLFSFTTDKKEIIEYFQDNPMEIDYFGQSFGCEPNGGLAADIQFNIIG